MYFFFFQLNEKASLYILDCLFSVLVIGTLVVFVWRGCWAMVDILLFPENVVWSAWGSLVIRTMSGKFLPFINDFILDCWVLCGGHSLPLATFHEMALR